MSKNIMLSIVPYVGSVLTDKEVVAIYTALKANNLHSDIPGHKKLKTLFSEVRRGKAEMHQETEDALKAYLAQRIQIGIIGDVCGRSKT